MTAVALSEPVSTAAAYSADPDVSLAAGGDSELYKAAALIDRRPADVLASIIASAVRRFPICEGSGVKSRRCDIRVTHV